MSHEVSQLKLSIIPPPARVVLFIKERLPIDVFMI
jgi:hypothetical protein